MDSVSHSKLTSSAPWIFAIACSFMLYGYEHIRSPSNALLVAAYGVKALPVVMAMLPLFAIPTLLLYNLLISRVGPQKTLLYTSLGSAICLLVTAIAIKKGSNLACAVLYWLRECYVLLLLEQVWSFINSVWDQSKAAKSNGYILAISNLGSMLGAYAVSASAFSWKTEQLLFVGVAMCFLFALVTQLGYKICPDQHVRGAQPLTQTPKAPPHSTSNGFKIFHTHRSLYWILLVVVTSQMYSTFATLQFQNLLSTSFTLPEQQIQYSGRFFMALCAMSVFIQLSFSRFLLCRFSSSKIHIAIPILHLVCCSWAFFANDLSSAACCLFVFKSLDYSLFRAAKELLYIPFEFDVRFRAKEWIDVLGYRGGKVVASLAVLVFQSSVWTSTAMLFAIFCCILWIYSVFKLFWQSLLHQQSIRFWRREGLRIRRG